MSDRAWDSSINSCFSSFHSLSCSSTVRLRGPRKGLIEPGIGLRISNARRTILARVSVLLVKQIMLSCSSSYRCILCVLWMSAIPVAVIFMLVIVSDG